MNTQRILTGFARWTWCVIKIYFLNLPNVWVGEEVYWECNQTFFTGTSAKENRDNYILREKQLIEELLVNHDSK